jgi:hypothetical protein
MRSEALRHTANSMLLLGCVLPAVLTSGCAGAPAPREMHDPHHLPNALDYYPDKAVCLGLTGRVGLEVSCVNGRFQNVVVVESAGSILDAGAKAVLSDAHCTPAKSPATRGPIGVIFQLTNKPRVPPFEDDRQTITVTDRYPPTYPISCK